MEKVNIFFVDPDRDQVLERLQDASVAQLVDITKEGDHGLDAVSAGEQLAATDYTVAGLRFAIDYLLPYEEKEGSALDRMVAGKKAVTKEEAEKVLDRLQPDAFVEKVQQVESDVNHSDNEKAALSSERELIAPWIKLAFVPNKQELPAGYDFRLIAGAQGVHDLLLKECNEETVTVASGVVSSDGKSEYVYVIASSDQMSLVDQAATRLGAEQVVLPDLSVSVRERLEEIASLEGRFEREREQAVGRARELAKSLSDLRVAHDYVAWKQARIGVLSGAGATSSVVVMAAWVEQSQLATLEQQLSEGGVSVAVERVEQAEDEEPPVHMTNKKWAAPFEAITGIYGSPGYNEPDPTPWLTPFFVVFFGLCLTDAGYGVFLAVLSALGLKFMAHTDEAKKLMKVMIIGGISTAILGALFGGWMGIAIDDLAPGAVKDFLVGIRLIDPIANPISVLILSFILGIFQVMVGLFVNIKFKLSQGERSEAFWGSGVWLAFLIVLVAWVMGSAGVLPESSMAILTPAVLGATGLVVLAGTRKTDNWFLKLPIGVLGLYDLVGYFSDVLSYSRLLALGLGTGIIAMVVNLIAQLAVEMVPGVGWVLFVLILLGGHLFNIAINVLGAYIHSSRLQFVEFFPKFMEGGGKVFTPFRKEGKYIRLRK